jgi:hypothetical protein
VALHTPALSAGHEAEVQYRQNKSGFHAPAVLLFVLQESRQMYVCLLTVAGHVQQLVLVMTQQCGLWRQGTGRSGGRAGATFFRMSIVHRESVATRCDRAANRRDGPRHKRCSPRLATCSRLLARVALQAKASFQILNHEQIMA